MIITLMGNDGSGKTTILRKIYAIFEELGFDVYSKHEYNYVLLKYFFKFIGKSNLDESRKEMLIEHKRSWKYQVWPILVWIDIYFQYLYFNIFKRRTIIFLDRYIYDHYMSFEHLNNLNWFTRWLYLHFPKPDIGIILWVEPEIAYERKKDTHTYPVDFYINQLRGYINLSNILKFPLVNTNEPIEYTIKKILLEIQRKSYIRKNKFILKKLIHFKVKGNTTIDNVSIIIPTFNRNDLLQKLLESLTVEIRNFEQIAEIIIVDDSEKEVARKIYFDYKKQFEDLTSFVYIYSGGDKYPSKCRNIGAKKSTGSILVFIDDDNILSGNVIKNISKCIKDCPCLGMLGIINYDIKGKLWSVGGKILVTPFTVILKNEKSLNRKEKNIVLTDYLPNLYSIRKEVFENINGFDDENFPLAMEEIDLALKVSGKGYLVCSLMNKDVYTTHLINDIGSKPLRPKRYYLRGRSRKMLYKKYFPNLLYWNMIPDIFLRCVKTFSYFIPLSKKIELIKEYIRGCSYEN